MQTLAHSELVQGQDTGHRVVVFGLSFCDHCSEGKAFLESEGVQFEFAYLDTVDAPIRAQYTARLRRAYGKQLIYPVLDVDGALFFGFDKDVWRDAIS